MHYQATRYTPYHSYAESLAYHAPGILHWLLLGSGVGVLPAAPGWEGAAAR